MQSVGVTWEMGRDPDASILQSLGGTVCRPPCCSTRNGHIVYKHLGALQAGDLDEAAAITRVHHVIDVDLALAFTTGMVATVNPCGFAMLPAYLSFFIGIEDRNEDDPRASVWRALVVGLAVTLGFAATFAVVGLLVSRVTRSVYDVAPWISLVIGFALVGLRHRLAGRFRVQRPDAAARQGRAHPRPRFDGAVRRVVRGRVDRL